MKAKLITFVRGLRNGTPPRFQSYLKSLTLILTLLLSVNAWAADEVYKTSKFGSAADSGTSNNYTSTFTTTTDGFSVDVKNGNTNNTTWALVKFGTNSAASTGSITTHAAIDAAVTKVSINISAITASKITSITLYSGSAANSCTTNLGTFTKATGTQSVTISSPAANKFYKIEFVCAKASSNGPISVAQVDFYKAASNPITSLILSEAGIETDYKSGKNVGDKYPLPSTCSQTCGTKTFVGWSTVAIPTPGAKPSSNFYEPGTEVTLDANNTFYAVFADASGGGTTSVTKDIIAEAGVTATVTLGSTAYQISDLPIQLTATKGATNWPIINHNNTKGDDLRFYKSSSSVTFATTNSQPITRIEFKKNATTNSDLSTYFSANVGTLSSNVWTGSANNVTITYNNADANFTEQMYIINVTYTVSNITYSNYTTSCGPSTYTLLFSGQKSGHFQASFLAPSQIVIWGFFAFFCKKVFHIRCMEGAWRMHGGSRPSSQPLFSPFGTLFAQPPFFSFLCIESGMGLPLRNAPTL